MSEFTYRLALIIFRGYQWEKNHPVDFQSSHHLLPELLRGAGETAFLVQGDTHMGWEGHLQISIGSERHI